MILKPLTLILFCSALLSCGGDWEIVEGPVRKYGEQPAPVAEPPVAAPPQPRQGGPVAPPQPLKDNPFAVPDVIKTLPDDRDLKPGNTSPQRIPLDPQEPEDPKATVTTRPPSAPTPPANPDTAE